MAGKADAKQASMVTATAAKGLVRVWWKSVVVLPPPPFVLEGGPAGVFKGGDSMVCREIPGIMILYQRGPLMYTVLIK